MRGECLVSRGLGVPECRDSCPLIIKTAEVPPPRRRDAGSRRSFEQSMYRGKQRRPSGSSEGRGVHFPDIIDSARRRVGYSRVRAASVESVVKAFPWCWSEEGKN